MLAPVFFEILQRLRQKSVFSFLWVVNCFNGLGVVLLQAVEVVEVVFFSCPNNGDFGGVRSTPPLNVMGDAFGVWAIGAMGIGAFGDRGLGPWGLGPWALGPWSLGIEAKKNPGFLGRGFGEAGVMLGGLGFRPGGRKAFPQGGVKKVGPVFFVGSERHD